MTEKKKRKPLKLTADDIGRFVRVHFDDIGAQDCILTDVGDDTNDFRILMLADLHLGTMHNNGAHIIAIGNKVGATLSGLPQEHLT